jgi:hypothetical protein
VGPHGNQKFVLLGLVVMLFVESAMAGSIEIGLPLVSGDISNFENRQRESLDLSAAQLQAMSHWLEQHKSGWQEIVMPATNEPIQLEVNLKHSDGGITSMCVIAQADGRHYLRVIGPGTWAYRSFAGIFKSWAATRSLSDQELTALLKILSAA